MDSNSWGANSTEYHVAGTSNLVGNLVDGTESLLESSWEITPEIELLELELLLPWEVADDVVANSSSLGEGVVTGHAINDWGGSVDNLLSDLEALLEAISEVTPEVKLLHLCVKS